MPEFENRFGKKFSAMDTGEKEVAIFSSLERIETHLEKINGKVKRIDRIDKIAWGGTVIVPFLAAWLAWLTKVFMGR